MGSLAVRTRFRVAVGLAVDILLRTTYVNRCRKGISHGLKYRTRTFCTRAAILGRNRYLSIVSSILSHKASNQHSQKLAAIQVGKQITKPPEMQSPVIVVTSRRGLITIERIHTDKPPNRVLPAQVSKGHKHMSHSKYSSQISRRSQSTYRRI